MNVFDRKIYYSFKIVWEGLGDLKIADERDFLRAAISDVSLEFAGKTVEIDKDQFVDNCENYHQCYICNSKIEYSLGGKIVYNCDCCDHYFCEVCIMKLKDIGYEFTEENYVNFWGQQITSCYCSEIINGKGGCLSPLDYRLIINYSYT